MSHDIKRTILVTGANGNVGTACVSALAQQSYGGSVSRVGIRAAVRHPSAFHSASDKVQAVHFDFMDTSGWPAALAGVDEVFLVRPPAITNIDTTLGPFIDQLSNHGVKKIVFLSLQGVERMPYVPHYKIEERIKASGIPFVFLRPSFFMQNLSTTHRREIAQDSLIYVPAGRGRTNFIHVLDIGEAAARVLTEAGHEGKAYELTGPDCLDYYQVAAVLSEILGRPIKYAKPSPVNFVVQAVRRKVPFKFALVQTGIYLAAALGKADHSSDDFEKLMGRKARDFRSFAVEMKDVWKN